MHEMPHNIEVEQALLGAILNNNDAFDRVADSLRVDHFFEPIHQQIYDIAGTLIRSGKRASPITVMTFIPKETDIAGLKPSEYLARLAAHATSILNAPDYAHTIKQLFLRRELLRISSQLADSAIDAGPETSAKAIIEQTEEDLLLLNTEGDQGGFVRFADAARESMEMAAAAFQRGGGLTGLPTGFIDLDHLMGGMQKSDLIIVAGRPAMGKSALAGNIAFNIASNDYSVGFFSLEMSREQVSTRLLSDLASVPSSRIRRGEITEQDFGKVADEAKRTESIPLYIEDSGGLTITQLITRARRLKRQRGLDLIIVDYLQLLFGSQRQGNRVQEVTEITTKLKALAKELNVPVIALSQLSRQVESRDDKRPILADLRESGSIEQDADVVIFVYREEYYLKNREPKTETEEWFKWEALLKAAEGKAEIIIGKQRHGPTGVVEMHFDARFTRFGNLAHERTSFKERGAA